MNYKFVLPKWVWGMTVFQILVIIAFNQVSILALMLCLWIYEGRLIKCEDSK